MGALVLSATAPAGAQATPDELAQRHFEAGAAYLEQSEYEDALREFEKAYTLSKRPALLLNVATVQERRGDLAGAIAALERYLTDAPEGEHVATVRIRIENLRKRLPVEATPEAPPAPPETTPETTPAPAPLVPAPSATASAKETPPQTVSIPGWVLLGLGAASGIGATVTGVAAKSKHGDLSDGCSPACTDDEVRPAKTLAWTSTALTGVAVVSAGVGAVLIVTQRPREEARRAPAWAVGATPHEAAVTATWRF